jgi:hypothetical protein
VATILRRITHAVGVVILTALVGAALVYAPQMVIPAVVLGALAGVVVYAVAVNPAAPPRTTPWAATRARAWRVGAVVALMALAVSGMAVLLGDATLPVLLFVALAVAVRSRSRIRPALAWIRARRVAPPAPAAPAPTRRPAAVAPPHGATLSTCGMAALCATWQRSYHHLGEVADEAARDALVDLRRRCLDEFERRDPEGTARWLATEPRPAGTAPHRHVLPGPPASTSRSFDGPTGEDPTTPPEPPLPPA